ncbi:MAG: hypothetical protein ACI31M_00425 [Bacilli bacterium]
MFGNGSPLTLTRIIGGLSKTVNIANQVIPLYRQAKPLISGFNESKKKLKDLASSFMTESKNNNNNNNINNNVTNEKTKTIHVVEPTNLPTFFH